jgi:RNA polymerase sigma-54 factor
MSKLVQTAALKQTIKMTASLKASLNLLQMSSLELKSTAYAELAKNPFLEENSESEEQINIEEPKQDLFTSYSPKSSNYDQDFDFISNIESKKTLNDHISEQIGLSIQDHIEKLVALYLLDLLEPNGYINPNTDEISKQLKCSKDLIKKVLANLQSFDPPGIFARNLKECLYLQLRTKGEITPEISAVLDNLELVANAEFAKLAKICKIPQGELEQIIAKIKTLNPKPANGFFVENTQYKIPDVILNILPNNEISLEINPEVVPKLALSNSYYRSIKFEIKTKEEKEFAKHEYASAANLVKAIDNRCKTILKVAGCIVQEQIDFFTRGIMYLKPLTLSKIAEHTGFNESTISRATAHKYIATPSGIYELKYFFSSSLSNLTTASSEVSSTKVKELIKQIIASEEPGYILSDEDISSHLRRFNINIARRTVAKYRESLKIETSAVRKRKILLK